MRDLEGPEWGAYLTIMYCDLRLASDTSNNVVKFTSDLSICLRNNRSKASNWPTLKACPLVKEYKYIMISYNVPISLNGGIPSLELGARTTIAESPRAK